MEHWKNLSLENLTEEIDGITYTEEWRPVIGYEDKYHISDFGRIKSLFYAKTNKAALLKQSLIKAGYLRVELIRRGNRHFIHRLVAIAFIPNPENKPQVNHKKGITTDNRARELEWATISEQQIHAIKVLGHVPTLPPKPIKGHLNLRAKAINQIDKKTNKIIKTYLCIRYAEDETGINNTNISSVAKGKSKSAGGFKWEYA